MHYVVGDVHGCYREMIQLIEKIQHQDPNAVYIFVGDYLDRGPAVVDTLKWFMRNISEEGKYQTVLGNHEDLVLQWYYACKGELTNENLETLDLPAFHYGLEKELINAGLYTKTYLEKIVSFLSSLPMYKEIDVELVNGSKQRYIIAHAFVPDRMEKDRRAYLYSRNHLWGYHGEGILIHGHTPTISRDWTMRHVDGRPGMIGYTGSNCINVDSGCVYHLAYGASAPCFLSAFCLETQTEISNSSLEERFEWYLKEVGDEFYLRNPVETVKSYVELYKEKYKI